VGGGQLRRPDRAVHPALDRARLVKAKVPAVAGDTDVDLESVTAISARQVWAVGEISVHNTPSQPYSLRWNGHTWSRVKVPDPSPSSSGDRRMLSVTAFGHGQLAAVGSTDGPTGSGPVYSRWNGQRWSVVIGPRNGAALGAVTTDGPRLWAVGFIGTNAFAPFIQVSH